MNPHDKRIYFTEPSFKQFKKAYAECNTITFMFEGNEFVKDYAKYLIEYVETHRKKT